MPAFSFLARLCSRIAYNRLQLTTSEKLSLRYWDFRAKIVTYPRYYTTLYKKFPLKHTSTLLDDEEILPVHDNAGNRKYFPVLRVSTEGISGKVLASYVEFIRRAAKEFEIPISADRSIIKKVKEITVPRAFFAHSKTRIMYARITYQNELTLYNISPETKKVFVDYIATHSPGGVFLALTDIEHFTLSQLIERCGGEAALQEYKNKDIEIMFNKSVLAADHTKDRFPASTRVLAIHEIAEKEHLPLEAALERAVQLGILAGNHERIVPPKIDDSVRLQSHVGIYTLEENHTFENKEQVLARQRLQNKNI